jgi:uncharacterized membrane protein YkoI
LACCLLATPLRAAENPPESGCLSKAEQRAAVSAKRALPLAETVKALRERRADLVRAQLCPRGDRLVYVLTLLARNGKVTTEAVDATTGAPAGR